jgi:flagellar hook-basal body complex protein FliE
VTIGPIPPGVGASHAAEADAAEPTAPVSEPATFADALGDALRQASSALQRADRAESAFVAGRGGLAEMVIERAQADVMLAVASAAASRTAQSLATLLNMQV